MVRLSIIIPAYNEENRISPTLEEYYTFFKKKFGDGFEIILVPNNCSDNTLEICKKFSKGKKQIKILNIPGYSGKGGAVIKGFKLAKGDYMGFVDADNATDAENFFKLYQNIQDFDCVIASRRIKGSRISNRTLMDNFSSLVFNKIVRFLFGLKFKDTQCGAKLFTKDAIKTILKNYSETGWIFDVDLLNILKKNSFRIAEIPIIWEDKSESKLTLKDKVSSLFGLFTYKIKDWMKKDSSFRQFLKFGIVGVVNTIINMVVLFFLTEIIGIYYMFSAVFAFLVAVTHSFVLNKVWTFKEKLNEDVTGKYPKFFTISTFALLVNLALLYILTEFLGIYYLFSQAIAILLSLWVNFFGNKIWTFKK